MMRIAVVCAASLGLVYGVLGQSWNGYGGNAQHTAIYNGSSQTVSTVHWQASLDDDRSYYGSSVLAHYASPMITRSNTVVYGYRHTTTVNGSPDYDNWSAIARTGSTGSQLWQLNTDYSAPDVYNPTNGDWTSVFPMTLCEVGASSGTTGVAVGAGAGSILVQSSADSSSPTTNRYVFYTTLQDFTNNEASYSPIKINTPLTADSAGNVYFGYYVTGTLPANLANLGTGGVAKVNVTTGKAVYQSVESLNIDSSLSRPAMNAAPAVSNDGTSVYFALTGGDAVLAKLDSSTLNATAHVQLFDPSVSGGGAGLIDESSASPMVGPDGHVFMGVFGYSWRESHGWMLQFDGNLNQNNASGVQYPVGSFGWDDTASVVASSLVPSYSGGATYLILTKYNNYDDDGSDPGADGSNKVAVLDPTSNSISVDRQSGIPVMNEVLTVLSPLLTNSDSNHPNARFEWCINSAAVDVKKKGAIINCEDGHVYRWSFATNTLTEDLDLQPATSEAYTSTSIGPDGQIYAINNSILFAIGSESISGLTFSPSPVQGGLPTTGTVTLAYGAPIGGWTVNLASQYSTSVGVPPSIMIPAGSTTGTFPITTLLYANAYTAYIDASCIGATQSAKLTVLGDAVSSLTLSPTSVLGGTDSTGTITLANAAPSGGLTVTLGSQYSTSVGVPASVTVPAGKTSATFTITTRHYPSGYTNWIDATYLGAVHSAQLTVTS